MFEAGYVMQEEGRRKEEGISGPSYQGDKKVGRQESLKIRRKEEVGS